MMFVGFDTKGALFASGDEERDPNRVREGDRVGEVELVGLIAEMPVRCFCNASCCECNRRYFWRANALSGDFWLGFIVCLWYFGNDQVMYVLCCSFGWVVVSIETM